MTDTEMLEWVATHMVRFHPLFTTAHMEYWDDQGNSHTIYVDEINGNELELLKACILKANGK